MQKKNSVLCLARPKFRLQQHEHTRVMLLKGIISYRLAFFNTFPMFLLVVSNCRTAEGKDQGFYGEKLQEQLGAWLAE